MKKSAEKLLNLMEKDSEFIKKVLKQESKEDVIKIADSKGIELTEEDIDIINEELKKRAEKMIFAKIDEDSPSGQLIKKMLADDSFAEKILSQNEEEKMITSAREKGINLSPEDIKEVNEKLMEISGIFATNLIEGELTEEELEKVAGGLTIPVVATAISTAVVAGYSIGAVALTAAVYTLDKLQDEIEDS